MATKLIKNIVGNLVTNDRIYYDGKEYYYIDERFETREVLFQSVDGADRVVISLDSEVDQIIEKVRGFEPVLSLFTKNVVVEKDGTYEYQLPVRKTARSSGYDFFCPNDICLAPKTITIVPTNIKAYMLDDEELQLSIRSGLSTKGIVCMNPPGKIDADYYSNESNDGNIGFILYNLNNKPFLLNKGDRIGQGTFHKYLVTDDDNASGTRTGGMGSTGR